MTFKPLFFLLVALTAVSCRTTERYIVTASAIDAIGVSQMPLCFAVESNNPQGCRTGILVSQVAPRARRA